MTSSPFASLSAGMLVRKGAAAPSLESMMEPRPRAVVPALGPDSPAMPPLAAQEPPRPPARPEAPPPPRPRLVQPLPHEPSRPRTPPSFAARAGVRLSRDQARALKLAALLLDRPQQELLADGLDLRLEAVACGPLAHCACFQAATEKLTKK